MVLNLTVTDSLTPGWVQAFPTGGPGQGLSSNLNIDYAGQTVAGLVTVPVGAGGQVSFYDQAGGHLIADVLGYFSEAASSGDGRYQALSPQRVLDSRNRTGMDPLTAPPAPPAPAWPGDTKNCADFATWAQANDWFWTYRWNYGDVANLDGNNDDIPCESLPGNPGRVIRLHAPAGPPAYDPTPKPGAWSVITLQITGRGGVPASGVSAVVLNVTAADGDGTGWVQVAPTGAQLGDATNVNFVAGQTVANLVMVPVGGDGRIQLYVSTAVDVVADVSGYFTDASAATSSDGLFVPVAPGRLMDTRQESKPGPWFHVPLAPGGRAGVPETGVSAVLINATITQPAASGWLQVFPSGKGNPGASSNLNYTYDQTVANAAIAEIWQNKQMTFYLPVSAHIVADVAGYFTDSTW